MTDAIGYVASSAVFATFLMRSMVPLRLVAIVSNLLFLSYGYLAHIHPVLVLHAALLPINVVRLIAHQDRNGSSHPRRSRIVGALTVGATRYVLPFLFGCAAGSLVMGACIYAAFAHVSIEYRY